MSENKDVFSEEEFLGAVVRVRKLLDERVEETRMSSDSRPKNARLALAYREACVDRLAYIRALEIAARLAMTAQAFMDASQALAVQAAENTPKDTSGKKLSN